MPELDCLFTNVFFYGVDDTVRSLDSFPGLASTTAQDDFATAADW